MLKTLFAMTLAAAVLPLAAHGATVTYDFNGFRKGEVISDLDLGPLTGTASATGGVNALVAFDTERPTGGDTDLAGPLSNLEGVFKDFGKVAIIQENNRRYRNGRFKPDDNARGGTMTFRFDQAIRLVSVDILDVEEPGVDIFLDGVQIASSVAESADHRFATFQNTDAEFGHELAFVFKGSGALDNLVVSSVPLPAGAALALTGVAVLAGLRRVQARKARA